MSELPSLDELNAAIVKVKQLVADLDAALARAEAAESDRAEFAREKRHLEQMWEAAVARAEKAEAQLAEAEAALRACLGQYEENTEPIIKGYFAARTTERQRRYLEKKMTPTFGPLESDPKEDRAIGDAWAYKCKEAEAERDAALARAEKAEHYEKELGERLTEAEQAAAVLMEARDSWPIERDLWKARADHYREALEAIEDAERHMTPEGHSAQSYAIARDILDPEGRETYGHSERGVTVAGKGKIVEAGQPCPTCGGSGEAMDDSGSVPCPTCLARRPSLHPEAEGDIGPLDQQRCGWSGHRMEWRDGAVVMTTDPCPGCPDCALDQQRSDDDPEQEQAREHEQGA